MPYDARKAGAKCDACPRKGQAVVPPSGPAGARACWLGQDPTRTEARRGQSFSGATGQRMLQLWTTAESTTKTQFGRANVWVTNAALCEPLNPRDAKESRKAMDCCMPRLKLELNRLHPEAAILAMGKWAFYQLTGQQKGVSKFQGFLCVPSWAKRGLLKHAQWFIPVTHPATTFRMPASLGPLAAHVENFLICLVNGRPDLPKLQVNPPASTFREFLQTAKAKRLPIAVDVETGRWGLLPGFAHLRAIGVGIADGPGWGLSWNWKTMPGTVKSLLRDCLADKKVLKVFQNGDGYDIPILQRHGFKVL